MLDNGMEEEMRMVRGLLRPRPARLARCARLPVARPPARPPVPPSPAPLAAAPPTRRPPATPALLAAADLMPSRVSSITIED